LKQRQINKVKRKAYKVKVWYRFIRKIVNTYRSSTLYIIKVRYRFFRRIRFKITRIAVFLFFKFWIKEIRGLENIPLTGPAILVSNHLSYYDFLIFGSILSNYIVFVATKKIEQTFFIRWFTKLHHVAYVDKDYPGQSFFRNIIRHLERGRLILIYPEGTRSRTGKMLSPKHGFVKLAIKTNTPIIPIAMKGTYEILPPSKHMPRLKRCSVIICKKFYISPEQAMFKDIFFRKRKGDKLSNLSDEEMSEMAFRIMDKIRLLAEEKWDENALEEIQKFKLAKQQAENSFIKNKYIKIHN